MIIIDGSKGEGGGQILRSALALSIITSQPFRIDNIRAGREKPGLMRQHLTCVKAAATICSAITAGAELNSQSLTFKPGSLKAGNYTFAIGTAGSTTLVLQTVLPALLFTPGITAPSRVTVEGGTHNSFAPPADFLQHAFGRQLAAIGADVSFELERSGFFPAGGGRIHLSVNPGTLLKPLSLLDAGELNSRLALATVAALPGSIALRELDRVDHELHWQEHERRVLQLPEDQGPGNVVSLRLDYANVTEIFTGFGSKRVTAEGVAAQAIAEAKDYLATGAPVGPYLADQLLLPLALAAGGEFVTGPLTPHTTTNADIIRRFLAVDITTEELPRRRTRITVQR